MTAITALPVELGGNFCRTGSGEIAVAATALEALPLTPLMSHGVAPSLGTEAVDKVLHAIRSHLGMDVAFVSEFRKKDRIFHHVEAGGRSPIQPGDCAPLEQGYCQRVVDGRLPELIPDTRRIQAARELPETSAIPIGSHLSVPIRLSDGRIYGTFCCFSFNADPSLGERDLQVMRVCATILADQIDSDLLRRRQSAECTERIQNALAAGQPSIAYQPIYDLTSRAMAGLESLSRFTLEPPRTPDLWFAEAAQVGLGVELELAAIRAALAALPQVPGSTYVAVNCSPATARTESLQRLLRGADIRRIVLELTEHDHIDDYPSLLAALMPLRALGLRIAVDDAGAGYASLRHVLNIQPDLIKLDISLTRGIDRDSKRRALSSALIAFGRETGAGIVAEGVESEAELSTLQQLGARCAQGYFLSRPLSLGLAMQQAFPSCSAGPSARPAAPRSARAHPEAGATERGGAW